MDEYTFNEFVYMELIIYVEKVKLGPLIVDAVMVEVVRNAPLSVEYVPTFMLRLFVQFCFPLGPMVSTAVLGTNAPLD